MNQIKDVLKQLSHKKRSENDLAQIIGNMCDETPNYTFLLGAGCSVTSGINNGQYLIKQWKKEIYDLDKNEGETEDDFWKRQYSWFDERNPYSSLFEKKFDLPRQRRIFVEKQIEGKTPSMGYAYLVKLIENKYINTIFTTNFDDLLNEAFYRYSKVRPIVCAHDSSISSITITSKRPKIIKLHGDYLFDDIKSTLRETESLNDNMKDKFIEFSKDHGLVVVGYAGNDRSIMDILNMLLQKEDYLKYGIYWCIREGDKISEELRKLLWKDRVYFVEISGFDELMAYLNKKLNNGELPVDDELLSSKRQKKLIKDMINNEYFDKATQNDKIIMHDIEELNKIVNQHIVDDVVDFLSKNEPNNQDIPRKKLDGSLNDKQKSIISQLQKLINLEDWEAAEQIIKNNDTELSDDSLYNFNLIKGKIELAKSRSDGMDISQLESLYDALIENWPDIQSSYLDAFYSIENRKGIKYLNKAITKFPNDYHLYNIKSKELLRLMSKESIIEEEDDLNELKDCIDKSISLYENSTNVAWIRKCDYFDLKYKNRTDERDNRIKEVYNAISNSKCISIVKILANYYKNIKIKDEDCVNLLSNILEFSVSSDNWKLHESAVMALLQVYQGINDKVKISQTMKEYEEKFKPSDDYLFAKVDILLYLREYEKAKKIIESNIKESTRWKDKLFNYYCKTGQREKAKETLDKYFDGNFYRKMIFNSIFGKPSEFLEMLEEYEKTTSLSIFLFSSKCCSLIKDGQYENAFALCKPYIENNTLQDGSTLINYYLSGKLSNQLNKVENKIKGKIISHTNEYDKTVLASAYAMVGDKQNMYNTLKDIIESNELMKFVIRDWPVFDEYKDDVKFKQLVDVSKIKF